MVFRFLPHLPAGSGGDIHQGRGHSYGKNGLVPPPGCLTMHPCLKVQAHKEFPTKNPPTTPCRGLKKNLQGKPHLTPRVHTHSHLPTKFPPPDHLVGAYLTFPNQKPFHIPESGSNCKFTRKNLYDSPCSHPIRFPDPVPFHITNPGSIQHFPTKTPSTSPSRDPIKNFQGTLHLTPQFHTYFLISDQFTFHTTHPGSIRHPPGPWFVKNCFISLTYLGTCCYLAWAHSLKAKGSKLTIFSILYWNNIVILPGHIVGLIGHLSVLSNGN